MGHSRQLAVIGIDGCGKSTVSLHLAKHLSGENNVCLVGDRFTVLAKGQVRYPKPMLELLRRLVHRSSKHARTLSNYKIPKMIDLILRDRLVKLAARRYHPSAIVEDGSPLINLVAWADLYREKPLLPEQIRVSIRFLTGVNLSTTEWHSLQEAQPESRWIRRFRLNRFTIPQTCLFLDIPAEVALERITSRSEPRQVHETRDKLDRLRRAYLKVLDNTPGNASFKCHILSAESPLGSVLKRTESIVSHNEPAD